MVDNINSQHYTHRVTYELGVGAIFLVGGGGNLPCLVIEYFRRVLVNVRGSQRQAGMGVEE